MGALRNKLIELQKENERLQEIISYLPKVPTQPYEKELAKELFNKDIEIKEAYALGLKTVREFQEERDALKSEVATKESQIAKQWDHIVELTMKYYGLSSECDLLKFKADKADALEAVCDELVEALKNWSCDDFKSCEKGSHAACQALAKYHETTIVQIGKEVAKKHDNLMKRLAKE